MNCPRCQRVIRWDESLSSRAFPDWGRAQVCEVCQAEADGLPVLAAPRYLPGMPIPRRPGSFDGDIGICGLCRVALPYGMERGTPLRIRPEMLQGEDVEPGGYSLCPDCMNYWRPRVAAYLHRLCLTCSELDCTEPGHARHLPTSAGRIGGNMLL